MARTTLGRLVGLGAWACLTLVALGLIAPTKAGAAGCGHPHNATGAADRQATSGLVLLGELGALPTEPAEAPDLPTPCSGPNCSKGRGVPLAPPPPPPPRVDPGGLPDLARPADRPAPFDRPATPADPRPIHRAEATFHPPR